MLTPEKKDELLKFKAKPSTTLDGIILKLVPVNGKCAIEEAYNKSRRAIAKAEIEAYIANQLANQFNAKPFTDQFSIRVDEDRERPKHLPGM